MVPGPLTDGIATEVNMAGPFLECELLSLLGGGEKARVMARYCGFDGLGGATLQVVGAEFGITAERVRQIIGEVVNRVAEGPLRSPALGRALAFIDRRVPAPAFEIELKMPAAGLSAMHFRIEGILRAAELFGHKPSFSLTAMAKGRLVHRLSMQSLDTVLRTARRAIERRGVTTIETLAADLLETAPEAADGRLLTAVLTVGEDLRWLDPLKEWFWLADVPRNPLVRRIRKVLSMANPVRFAELCSGIAREYRLQSYSPPAAILLELCRQTPGVQVERDWIRAEPRPDPRAVLGEMEQAIADVLLANGGVMRRADLASVCFQRGLNRASFYSSLSHSTVIAPHPGGLVGVIGTEIAPDRGPAATTRRRSLTRSATARANALSLYHLMH
jgi:hypothetical protein